MPNLIKPGLFALNLNDGSIAWSFYTKADCPDDRKARMPGMRSGCSGLSGAKT